MSITRSFNVRQRIERSIKEGLRNIYDNALRFQWTQQFINEAINKLYVDCDLNRLPDYYHQEISGYRDCLYDLHQKHITHAYTCNDGKRRLCGSFVETDDPYEMPSENNPKSLLPDTCVSVYKEEPHKVYFDSRE